MKPLSVLVVLILLCGCGEEAIGGETQLSFDANQGVCVVSREEGSGTREAFVELFGIRARTSVNGALIDRTASQITAKTTEEMLAAVAENPYAIGYVSAGALTPEVKALTVDGYEATPANIQAGSYGISCPLLLATRGRPTGAVADFLRYVKSAEGQAVVADGYIPVEPTQSYTAYGAAGNIVLSGSSAAAALVEDLIAAYQGFNPNVTFEIRISDSATGLAEVYSGECQIAMSSRHLAGTEANSLIPVQMATDGICIIVHPDSTVAGLTSDQVKRIFLGRVETWNKLGNF